MPIPYARVNGFTNDGAAGNAAGVMLPYSAKEVPEDAPISLSKAINFSETVFVDELVKDPLRITLGSDRCLWACDDCLFRILACKGLIVHAC